MGFECDRYGLACTMRLLPCILPDLLGTEYLFVCPDFRQVEERCVVVRATDNHLAIHDRIMDVSMKFVPDDT